MNTFESRLPGTWLSEQDHESHAVNPISDAGMWFELNPYWRQESSPGIFAQKPTSVEITLRIPAEEETFEKISNLVARIYQILGEQAKTRELSRLQIVHQGRHKIKVLETDNVTFFTLVEWDDPVSS